MCIRDRGQLGLGFGQFLVINSGIALLFGVGVFQVMLFGFQLCHLLLQVDVYKRQLSPNGPLSGAGAGLYNGYNVFYFAPERGGFRRTP